MTVPRISIVIVAYGRRDVTERCLESLESSLAESLGDVVELILVDNASPDDTRALFESWRERATVVALEHNRNFAGGCNAGAAAARGDVLVFLNNDTVVEPGSLEALAAEASHPAVGAAGLRLLYLDGTLQHAGVGMIRVPSGLVVPHHLFHHQDGRLPAVRVTYDLDAVTGACLAIPRELFLELGGFDEGYVNGWEDVDLCLRVRVAGRRVVYRGDLWLWHDEGQTRGVVRGADANAGRFYARWGSMLEPDDELARLVFGGRLGGAATTPSGEPAAVAVTGMITGVTGAGAEARGLIAACEAASLQPAARDWVGEMVHANLTAGEAQVAGRALDRAPRTGAPHIHVPADSSSPPSAIVRLARMPTAVPDDAPAVLAASPRLRGALISAGMGGDRVVWWPSCVPTGPAGPGGEGVLAVLPGHDLDAAATVLRALAGLGVESVRVLPTVASTPLLALVNELLPAAETLLPCPSDALFRELACTADVVVCADPDDCYERRALIAAGAGAAVVVAADGPAHAVLQDDAVTADQLHARELAVAFSRSRDRTSRAELVARTCSEQAAGERLLDVLGTISAAASARMRAVVPGATMDL